MNKSSMKRIVLNSYNQGALDTINSLKEAFGSLDEDHEMSVKEILEALDAINPAIEDEPRIILTH